jgi:saccharopine dehydrogenase-like NADP-dependent oxidoreductase
MKVIILGGHGFIGSATARELIRYGDVNRVTLADIDARSERIADALRQSPKVTETHLDISDRTAVTAALAGHDVVLNCVGPYSETCLEMVELAIEAGIDYVDVCDSGIWTRRIFDLDGLARARGSRVVTGAGSSPGLTNVLARYGADQLDSVQTVEVAFIIALIDPLGRAGLTQAIGQFVGEVTQFIDRKSVEVPGGSQPETVEFLAPFAANQVYFSRHPESFTLPRGIPGLERATSKGTFSPPSVPALFNQIVNLGLFDDTPVMVAETPVSPRDFIVSHVQNRPELRGQPPDGASFGASVTVRGKRAGQPASQRYRFVAWAGKVTVLSTAAAVVRVGRGGVGQAGVYAPESAFDAADFIAEMQRRGISFQESRDAAPEVEMKQI